jgi:ketosteroid isomerase-like protein
MAGEAQNVDILRDAYARWHDTKGGSVDHWLTIVADDINFGSLARGLPEMAFARTYRNREAMGGYFKGLLSEWEMIHYTVGEFVAQGDAVFMRGSCSWRHKRTGRTVDTPKVDFWRFRDGKAVEFYEYYDTARVVAAAAA